MLRIVFKNMDTSELAKDITSQRMATLEDKFPELVHHAMRVTLSMENSPLQPGPDLFTVKLWINGRSFRSVVIEKSASSLYVALADVVDHALERLNRYGDKTRVRRRKQSRLAAA